MTKGTVILEYNLSGALQAAQDRLLHDSVAEACALFGGCMLLWSLLHVMVTERILKIVGQMQNTGWETELPESIQGPDELAQVSQSFASAVGRLRATEQRFRHIASSMRDVFWVAPASPDDPIYVNPAYERLFGSPGSRLISSRWEWLRSVVKEDRRKVLQMLQRLRQQPGETDMDIRIERDDGTRWMSCRCFSVQRPEDKPGSLQVMGVIMDITVRKRLERQLIEVAEQERRRIGQDLHDDICQRLAAAHLKTGVLQNILSRAALPQTSLAADIAIELAEASDIARRFAKGLAPVALGADALPLALTELAAFLQRAFNLRCTAACDPVEGLIHAEAAAQIYRIAQELSTNAAKHSEGTWIHISVAHFPTCLHLEISHDGLAFTPRIDGQQPAGMGLHIVQQRVDALDATLSFHPRPASGGTLAICEIPLLENAPSATPAQHV